jgi:hypothetical protein
MTIEVTNPLAREQTMTKVQDKAKVVAVKEHLKRDEDFVRSAVQSFVQAALEVEMTEALGAEKSERTEGRLSYRSGYHGRALITRVGTLELRVRQDRGGTLFDGAVPALSAFGEGLGWDIGGDVCAKRFDSQSEGCDRSFMRP